MNLWRYQWLLYGVVACIVIVPYFMLERVNRVIHQADQMVAHTAQVESVTSKLLYEVRDLEAAAATITEGIDVPNVRRRVAETSGAIPELMSQLIELTSDNPQQQVRVGELKAKIDLKVQAASKSAIEAINKAGGSFEKVATPIRQSAKEVEASDK